MEQIIEAVDVDLIKQELTSERFIRKTNKANNEIYVALECKWLIRVLWNYS